jgi:hypothetical protein
VSAERNRTRDRGSIGVASEAGRTWLAGSYVYAAVVALGLGYFLLRVPIQLTDCLSNMVVLDQPWGDLMRKALDDRAYLRPGLWAQLKIVFDLAGGNYFLWFRLTQVIQVALLILLFVRLVQPRTAAAAAAIPLALGVLIGHHTFAFTVREAFPINTFLTILVSCALAANVAFGQRRPWSDVVAVALLVVSAATVESGVLVWVIFVGGYLLGLRAVSKRGMAALTAVLIGYFVIRSTMGVGLPGLEAREAGFGFTRYSGSQLQAMFGANPYGFYAHNVAVSILGVLFAEPRDGVWRLVRAANRGDVDVPAIVNVVASTFATLLIAGYGWARRREWMRLDFDHRDRLVLMFVFVLAANAAMSFAYTKDVIMSPAGFFCAAAVFAAAVHYVDAAAERRIRHPWLVTAMMAVLACTWAVRAVGIHAALSETASTVREQWASVDDYAAGRSAVDEKGLRLRQHLQDDAVVRYPAKPSLRDEWVVAFDVD